MTDVVDELRAMRERTDDLERELRDGRFTLAVTSEALARGHDRRAALELADPVLFVLDGDGTPLNVKEIFDRLAPALEQKTVALRTADDAAKQREASAQRLPRGYNRMQAAVARSVNRPRPRGLA